MSSFTTFKRVLKAGSLIFFRNGWLSTATVIVMTLMLFVMGNLIFVKLCHIIIDHDILKIRGTE